MADQLWRQIPDEKADNDILLWGDDGAIGFVVPVAAGALLIEDGMEAAATRAADEMTLMKHNAHLAEFPPETRQRFVADALRVLGAAVGFHHSGETVANSETTALRDDIAKIIHAEYHWAADGIITPECTDMCGHAADRIVALLCGDAAVERMVLADEDALDDAMTPDPTWGEPTILDIRTYMRNLLRAAVGEPL